jgi:hypothetical protein
MQWEPDWPWLSSSQRVASSPYDPSIPDAVNNPMVSQQQAGAPGGIVANNLGTDGQSLRAQMSEPVPKSDVSSVEMLLQETKPSTDLRYRPWKARHRPAVGKVTFEEKAPETYDIPLETSGTALTPATIKSVPIAGTLRAPMLQGKDPLMLIGSGIQGKAPRSGIELDPRNPPQTETQLYLASQGVQDPGRAALNVPYESMLNMPAQQDGMTKGNPTNYRGSEASWAQPKGQSTIWRQ